ncbi:MAG: leucine-rich repeat domain-containing protein [Lachnospiraceae bacterium]
MQEQKTHKGIQLFALLCSMFIMAFLFALTPSKEAKAKAKVKDKCTLQSVTIEVDGKEYVCTGEPYDITVARDVDWKEFVKKIKVTDYRVLMDDCCSHVKGHDSITAYLAEGMETETTNWVSFYTYADDGNGGKHTYTEIEDSLTASYYSVRFCLDGDKNIYVRIWISKEATISYELNEGKFPDGIDVPYTCVADTKFTLVSPVKSDGQFLGWTLKGDEDSDYISSYTWDGTGNPPTFVANWDNTNTPIDIEEAITDGTVTLSGLQTEYGFEERGVRPSFWIYFCKEDSSNVQLLPDKDYFVTYKNNDKIAQAGDENPPTVIITGIGKYTGTIEKTFLITKGTLYLPYDYNSGRERRLDLDIIKGQSLSSIDFSDAYVCISNGNKVEGTFAWVNGDYVPQAEVGTVLFNDSDNSETTYNLTFTPDNTDCYDVTTFTTGVYITVKEGDIEDCSVTFAPDQNYQYTGEEIKPKVVVKDGDTTLTEGTDYEVSYAGYINIASSKDKYAPTVTIKGIGDYTGSKKLTYTIEKRTPYIAKTPTAAINYGQTLGDSKLSGGTVQFSESNDMTVKGTFTWKEAAAKPTVADSGKTEYVVVFNPTDTEHYTSVEAKITLTVNKAEAAPNRPGSTMDTVYTNATVEQVTLPEGWVWQDADKTKELMVGEAVTATAIYNGADKGSYETESVEVSITRLAPTDAPAAGTTDTSDDGTATYKVTTSDLTKGTVAYVAPTNKNATTVSVPATATIDGITYKVTSIADNAFANNKKLTKVTIGSNVTTISDKAFYKCTALTKITIPSKVKKIGKQAFYGCKKLKSITIKTTKLTSKNVGSSAFKGIYAKATIKVPKSKLTSYKTLLKAKGVSSKAKIKK